MQALLLRNKYILLLILCAFLGYFQMFIFELKWDNIDAFLPYRFHIDQSIKNGEFPLWNHTINLGYPIHADPQSGTWYPFTWITSLLFGYNFASFGFEVWLHFLFSGIGMYLLGISLKLKNEICFVIGVAYMFCGFMVASAEIYPFIVGATWLPYLIRSLVKIRNQLSFFTTFELSIFVSLTILGAYPAFIILTIYLVGLFFIYLFIQKFKIWHKIAFYGILALILIALLSGGYLFSVIENYQYMGRSEPLKYNEFFYSTSINFTSLISVVYPYSTTCFNTDFFNNANPVMINSYFGLVLIPFVIYYIVKVPSKIKYWVILFVVIAFLSAMGNQTPVRYWLYKFIPGFNLFRHPAMLRLYGLIMIILMIGKGLNHFLQHRHNSKFIFRSYIIISLTILITSILILVNSEIHLQSIINQVFSNIGLSTFSIENHIVLQSIFLIIISIACLFIFRKNTKKLWLVFSIIVVVDLIGATQLNISTTITSSITNKACNDNLKDLIINTPKQNQFDKIGHINHKQWDIRPIGYWQNISMFTGKTAYDGYNPFQLKRFNELEKMNTFNLIKSHPLVYFSDDQNCISNPEVIDLQIGYNQIQIEYRSSSSNLLKLSQNYHKNWSAYINNENLKVKRNNHALMAVNVPSGIQSITFRYEPKMNPWLFLIISFLGFLSYIITLMFRSYQIQKYQTII